MAHTAWKLNIQSAREISSAIQAHFAWKSRIQAIIDNTATENFLIDKLSADDQCVLGQWIHDQGHTSFADDALFQTLRKTHTYFHQCAGHAMMLAQSGQKEKAQESILSGEFAKASRETVETLTQIYLKAKQVAPGLP